MKHPIEHSVDQPNKVPLDNPANKADGANLSKSQSVLVKNNEQMGQLPSISKSQSAVTGDHSPIRRERRSDYPTSPSRAKDLVTEAMRRKEEEEERRKTAVKPQLTPAQQAEQDKKELLGELSMADMNQAQKDIVEQQ